MPLVLRFRVLLFLLAVAAAFSGAGCNRYVKMSRSRNLADRDSAAFYFYNKKKYEAASILFEELIGAYRGSPRAAAITYYYAMTKYQVGEYITSAHHFQQYVDQFPNSDYTEDAMYMVGESHKAMALDFEHDQTETAKAIESFQLFLSLYPTSKRVDTANKTIRELRDRMARKALYEGELYYRISHFRAATVALKVVMGEYGDSPYRERAQYLLFHSQVLYADNSVADKQESRYLEAMAMYNRFLARYPSSQYLRQAERIYQDVEDKMRRINKNKPVAAPAAN